MSNLSLSNITKEVLEEAKKKKPSAGLSKKKKTAVVKKAQAGKNIGKKGKNFEKMVQGLMDKGNSKESATKIAAASMWKNIPRGKKMEENMDLIDKEGGMAKNQLFKIAEYASKLMKILGDTDQLPAWAQSHISQAEQLMDQVGHYLEYQYMKASVMEQENIKPAIGQLSKLIKKKLDDLESK
jgi:hypothetical protein